MTVDFFIKAYDFNNFEIKKAVLNNYELTIYVTTVAHLDLIANGYRPELDVNYDTAFTFKVTKENDIISNLENFKCIYDNKYFLVIGNKKYELASNDIKVHESALK